MDTFARGLRQAAHIIEEGTIPRLVKERYSSFDHDIGKKIEEGTATFEELEQYALQHGEPKLHSGKQEKFKSVFNQFQ